MSEPTVPERRPNGQFVRKGRGHRWAPFEKGHTLSMRTGHRSERTVQPLADRLVEGLLLDRPELERFPESLLRWARAEARCLLLADGEFIDDDGKPVNAHDIARFERQAAEFGSALGLSPLSELELRRAQRESGDMPDELLAHAERVRVEIEARNGDGS